MPQWLILSLVTLACWGTYTLFGNKANQIHGENMTMGFEGAAMMLVGLVAMIGARGDFAKVSPRSAIFATVMGLLSAIGVYLQFKAIRLEPAKVGTISLLTGMWPIVTLLVAAMIGQQALTLKSAVGALIVVVGLVVVAF